MKLNRNISVLATSSLTLLALSAPLAAQTAARETTRNETDSLEEVVVTGLRSVSGTPKNLRRSNQAIVDSITAEQIARLPDESLAESLDRVVGVSAVPGYNSSDARTVTVRGFDSRYNSMTVDGVPIWNSSRNNRGTQSDVFPASVVNQTNVFKTYTPEQDGNSIGAHIEMRTLRAFDGGTQPYFKAQAAAERYEQDAVDGGDEDPGYSVNVVGKFTFGQDSRFGVVLGADLQQHHFFDKNNRVTGVAQRDGLDIPAGNLQPNTYTHDTERSAFYGKFETRASDQFYAFVSANYYRMQEQSRFNYGGVFLDGARVRDPVDGSGAFVDATDEVQFGQYELDRTTTLLATGLDYRLNDRGVLQIRGSVTDYDHFEVNRSSEKFQFNGLSGSYDVSRTYPRVTIDPNPGLGDPANWRHRTGRDAYDQFIPHEDQVYSLRADYAFNNQPDARGLGYKFGVNWRRLDRDFNQARHNYRLPSGTVFTLADVLAPGQALPLNGIGPVSIDADAYWEYMRARVPTVDDALATDYRLEEDVYAGHAGLTFATDKLRALAGVRVEETRVSNETADAQPLGEFEPATRTFDYTNVLPNVQVSYDPAQGWRLRAAYTQAIGRPDFNNFAMGQRISLDANGYPVIQGSNPYLDPRQADNYDFAVEYYFPQGFAYAGLFYKDLHKETFTQRRETRDDAGVVVLTETTPLNSGSGTLEGFEVGLVIDHLTMLPGWLSGFGINTNYTYLEGDWDVVFTDGSRRTVDGLRNQPEWLANLNLSYAAGPLELTAGWRLRGRTFTGSFGTTAAGDRWIDAYDRIDIKARYSITRDVDVFASVRNLNNAYFVEQTGLDGDFLYEARNPGRSYQAGVRVKF